MFEIRQENQNDYKEVYSVVKKAFETAEHSDGNEHDLVTVLRNSKNFIPELSLVAIEDNKIVLSSESSGKENYSLQLVQAAIPLKKNNIYRLSFDARAAENRDMVINITSPDRGYIRQLQDTTVDLKNEFQKYSYEFTMKDNDDANARVEFNYGNRNSLADIEITNVRLEKIGETIYRTDLLKDILIEQE